MEVFIDLIVTPSFFFFCVIPRLGFALLICLLFSALPLSRWRGTRTVLRFDSDSFRYSLELSDRLPIFLRHQGDGVLAQVVLHVVEEMRLFIASERTLETLVLEGLARWPRDIVGPFRFALLCSLHFVLNTPFLKEKYSTVGDFRVVENEAQKLVIHWSFRA